MSQRSALLQDCSRFSRYILFKRSSAIQIKLHGIKNYVAKVTVAVQSPVMPVGIKQVIEIPVVRNGIMLNTTN